MKKSSTPAALRRQNAELRARLGEAEATLDAIRKGEVDALVVGEKVYTLQGAETPYRILVETMNEGAALLVGGRVRYCNSRLAEMVGWPLENLIGVPIKRLVSPVEASALHGMLMQNGQMISGKAEFTLVRSDKTPVPVQFSLSELELDGARGICLVVTDLSERKKAEAGLRESEERFRQMAENVQEVFWLVEAKTGRILYVSPAYETIWGRSRQELYEDTANWAQAVHPEDLERVNLAFSTLHAAKNPLRCEFRILRPDGETRWISNQATLIRDDKGEIYRVTGVARDVSEQKNLQGEVERVSEMERQRLGHDLHDGLCQYLTAMSMLSDVLQKNLRESGRPEALDAAKIAQHARDAMAITHDLSRALYPGSLQISGLGVALSELTLLIQKMFPITCQSNVKNHRRLADANLERQLFRIAQEAAFNAGKHSQGRHVWITLEQTKQNLILTVKDDGRGVSQAQLKASYMGLRIMHYRANLIGADLQIDGESGRGTVVKCTIRKPAAS